MTTQIVRKGVDGKPKTFESEEAYEAWLNPTPIYEAKYGQRYVMSAEIANSNLHRCTECGKSTSLPNHYCRRRR